MQTTEALKHTEASSTAPPATKDWTEVIEPRTSLLDLRLGDVWRYRDLVMMFVKRDFVSTYKQTILGPLWFFIQPLLTTVTFIIVFSRVANLSTDGLPPVVFYLAGITVWSYFSVTLTTVSTVFVANAAIFGKVYFPRLTMPVSIVVSNMVRFLIQFGLFMAIWLFYVVRGDSAIQPNWVMALTPVLLIMMGLMSLGLGMIFSALTTKYRDLAMLLTFGIQLLMYATPIIYPLSSINGEVYGISYKSIILANPMSSIVETFKYGFLGSGAFNWGYLGYSAAFTVAILIIGTIIFNKVEKSFTDTV